MTAVLAVDLGTSGVKVAVVDGDGRVLASATEWLPTLLLPDGGAEQDANGWWDAIGRCARAITGGIDVDAVAVTAQYSSVVAVDDAGRPLANAVMWMDRRGAPLLKAMVRDIDVGLWLDRHGMVPSGGCDQAHIAVLRAKGIDPAAFVEPVDAINARLTGRITATQTTAFPLMTIDNRTRPARRHDPELVRRAGLDPATLPPLVPDDEPIGPLTSDAAAHLGITTRALVCPGTIDSVTSAVGCGAVDPSTCAVIIGTTSVIATHIPDRRADLDHALLSVPSPVRDSWFVMAENGIGGKSLEWFLRELVYPDDALALGPMPEDAFERAEAAAATVEPGCGGVLFLPWLVGSMAPVVDGRVRAAFVDADLATRRATLTRAVYEGVALNAAWLLPHVRAIAGGTWDRVRFGGGGATSSLWAQILADTLDTPVEQLASPGTTNARGAAFLALDVLGHRSLDDIPAMLDITGRFEPEASAVAIYGPLRDRFVELHALLRPSRADRTGPPSRGRAQDR